MPRHEKCETCRFWEQLLPIKPPKGRCRRYPPTVALDTAAEGEEWLQMTPEMYADDWCGEWQAEPTG